MKWVIKYINHRDVMYSMVTIVNTGDLCTVTIVNTGDLCTFTARGTGLIPGWGTKITHARGVAKTSKQAADK